MQLKTYQKNSLKVLKSFFEHCRIMGHIEAFKKITAEPEIAARLVNFKNGYTAWGAIPNTPRVCLKVPTGGGKTIIAAHAVKIVSQTWCEKEHPWSSGLSHRTRYDGRPPKPLKIPAIPTTKP